jgi:hypothetical protein
MLAGSDGKMLAAIFVFGKEERAIDGLRLPAGTWKLRLNSADQKWKGPGNSVPKEIQAADSLALKLAGQSFVLLESLTSTSE